MRRAASFLAARQDDDGAFRSRAYRAFADGYSLTPLALTALYFASDDGASSAAYRRGVDFLAGLVTPSGSLREGLDGPSYPVYAIAGAILVLNVPANARHHKARDVLILELRRRQLSEERGWQPDDPSHGAWSYFHGLPDRGAARDATLAGNLSATLFAIGALRLAGVPASDPALVEARAFVQRCQNFAPAENSNLGPGPSHDGGFFFSPVIADSNKAGPLAGPKPDDGAAPDAGAPVGYRSYGSMTADGLRALVQLGALLDHPRVSAAATWLEKHYDPRRNPGAFPRNAEIRRASSYFYYAWTSSHALRALGKRTLQTEHGPVDWPHAIVEELVARQLDDGSWLNPYSELREDDPILATSFATAALAIAHATMAGQHRSHRAPAGQ